MKAGIRGDQSCSANTTGLNSQKLFVCAGACKCTSNRSSFSTNFYEQNRVIKLEPIWFVFAFVQNKFKTRVNQS